MKDDIWALGTSAPLRAAYEASKRCGGHRFVFGLLAAKPVPPVDFRSSIRFPTDIPDAAVERTVKAAEEIVRGTITIFSQPKSLGSPADSHCAIENSDRWPMAPWWTIDIRSDSRAADVKWVWELGRIRHLAVLARAASVRNGSLAVQANRHLCAWANENPPEMGINWYSNLELALRSITLTEIGARLSKDMNSKTMQLVTSQMWHAGRHLVSDLPYTVSTMRNNHLLGDAIGLQVIGSTFAQRVSARRLSSLGDHLFAYQAKRHFRDDGSMVEDSLSYHRFVLEMLTVHAMQERSTEAHPALLSSAQMLARLGAIAGPVPQYGDWDEGRVLSSTQDPSSPIASVRAALSMAGSGASQDWREAHDECAWYVERGDPVEPETAERDGHDVGGGIARAQRGCFTAWLKAGSGPSHGHADLCSTPILVDGEWVVGDPGTGTYNGPIEQRNYFRSSKAHSVLRLGGLDQLEPYRAFRWKHTAAGSIGPPVTLGEAILLWGGHNAYTRLSPPQRLFRTVVMAPTFVVVADWIDHPAGQRYELSIPFGPRVRWDAQRRTAELSSGRRLCLTLPDEAEYIKGQESPFDGWWSRTYGSIEPSIRLEIAGDVQGPVCWSVAVESATPHIVATPDELLVGSFRLAAHWRHDCVWLNVEGAGHATELMLRFAT